jgi:alpha-tubulin suppressor-like RCC1 family protein
MNGSVECWGDNSQGQLGNGTTTSSAVPTAVASLSHVVRIAANYEQTCALLDSGKAYCWGLNDFGQMGDGTQFGTRLSPVAVSLSGNAVEIAVGLRHACAVMQDGSAQCWGWNNNGALGNGVIDTSVTVIPASVVGLQQSKQIALGSYHSCASLADGGMNCWGYNAFGQVGDGSKVDRGSAVAVSGLSGVVEFGLGSQYTCARLTDGTVKCWGLNYDGSLGDGTDTNRPLPVYVLALP